MQMRQLRRVATKWSQLAWRPLDLLFSSCAAWISSWRWLSNSRRRLQSRGVKSQANQPRWRRPTQDSRPHVGEFFTYVLVWCQLCTSSPNVGHSIQGDLSVRTIKLTFHPWIRSKVSMFLYPWINDVAWRRGATPVGIGLVPFWPSFQPCIPAIKNSSKLVELIN